MYSQFCCKIRQFWWEKFIKLMKFWWKKYMRFVIQFKTRIIQIPYFRIVNLLCCEGHFSSVTFIDAKTKYRSSFLLDVSQPYL